MSILALELEGSDAKFDPDINEKLLNQLVHAERYATNKEQLEKIISLQGTLRWFMFKLFLLNKLNVDIKYMIV